MESEIDDILKATGWGSRFIPASWCRVNELIRVQVQEAVKKAATEALMQFSHCRGMFITGPVGVGKTSLMCLLARYFIRNFSNGTRYISAARLVYLLYSKNDAEKDVLYRLRYQDILFIDDLNCAGMSDYALASLEEFVDDRYARQATTFFTSNISLDEMRKIVGMQRVADRINDKSWMIHFFHAGESKRKR